MKALTIFIIALTALNFGTVAAFADDMWSETPNLKKVLAAKQNRRSPDAIMIAEQKKMGDGQTEDKRIR